MADYDNARWRKSRRSGNGNNCVEVATNLVAGGGMVLVRDSKDSTGPILTFGQGEWKAFLDGVEGGEFHL